MTHPFPTAALIDGQWVTSRRRSRFSIPRRAKSSRDVPDLSPEDTRRAIDAAARRSRRGRPHPPRSARAILRRWFDLIIAETEALAQLMTPEQGKPLAEARGEVAYGASFVEWFAEEGKRAYGDTIPSHHADRRIVTLKQPIGVCAAITPWNFPIAMITRKVGAGARGRLHRGHQAVGGDAAFGAGARRSSPTMRACRRASSTSSPPMPARSARR